MLSSLLPSQLCLRVPFSESPLKTPCRQLGDPEPGRPINRHLSHKEKHSAAHGGNHHLVSKTHLREAVAGGTSTMSNIAVSSLLHQRILTAATSDLLLFQTPTVLHGSSRLPRAQWQLSVSSSISLAAVSWIKLEALLVRRSTAETPSSLGIQCT